MKPTDVLRHEHDVILLTLTAAEREARAIAAGERANRDRLVKMVGFFREFADSCHHAKEERLLFPAMNQSGLPRDAGPIAVMLAEHAQGREYVRAIALAVEPAARGDAEASAVLVETLQRYVELLRAHIRKENEILFKLADSLLSADQQAALAAAFERLEWEETGAGEHERLHHVAHELAAARVACNQ